MSLEQLALTHLRELAAYASESRSPIALTGRDLTLAAVVTLSRNQTACHLDPKALQHAAESARVILKSIRDGETTYGVNTGFGGSANTQTDETAELQRHLMRGLHYGIMAEPLLTNDPSAQFPASMPESWSRAAMVIRLNSLLSGSSGVQIPTLECLHQLIDRNVVPRIPCRGSISASGDLSPLSYIGGTMQGKNSISVFYGDGPQDRWSIISAHDALSKAGIGRISLQAKEGLAIVNGTAMSTGVAALAFNESLPLYILSLLLTAMSTEALTGTEESFDEYFSTVRPHSGQREAARLIRSFLSGSSLTVNQQNADEAALRQDRHSIRTAPQWCGPVQEDMLLAHEQISVELNSVTDNPLIDINGPRILHGGNFQAKSITSACDKLRVCLQSLGRMLFTQCTEIINPATNRGLPPNLVVDEPSRSFLWKGTDIMVAALTSELGFLANPVGTHVQTAEMGNQALNSLALISSRYTLEAVDCLTQLIAAHLVAVCQALDIRAVQAMFASNFKIVFAEKTLKVLNNSGKSTILTDHKNQTEALWTQFLAALETSMSMDTGKRFLHCVKSVQASLLDLLDSNQSQALEQAQNWTRACAETASQQWQDVLGSGLANSQITETYLGRGSRIMYRFVRQELQVPCIHDSLLVTPQEETCDDEQGSRAPPRAAKMGDHITRVYQSIRNGKMNPVLVALLEQASNET